MDSKKMKKRPNSGGKNCDVPKKKLKKNCTFVEQKTTIKESVTKRKATDELFGFENKKKCACTSSSSSNKKSSPIYNTMHADALERTMKLKEKKRNLEKIQNTSLTFDELEYSYPHRLLSLMYQIELSTLCLIRKSMFEKSTKQICFENSQSGQFNNISVKFINETFQIMVKHLDTYYLKECLNFNSLFSARQGNFTLRNYLNEFAFDLCYTNFKKQVNYLIFYTNGNLDLTLNGKLKNDEFHLRFVQVSFESDPNLMKLLRGREESGGAFYRFANDVKTKRDLKFLLKFTKNVENYMNVKGYCFDEIREAFFERLIFAVNQPSIEELAECVRTEETYCSLRSRVLRQLKKSRDNSGRKLQNLSSTVYSFDLFNLCLQDAYKNQSCIKFHETIESSDIVVGLESKFLHLRVVDADLQLPLENYVKQQGTFSINSQFAFFLQHFDEDLEYFVIYTNGRLPLVEELLLGDFGRNIRVFSRIDAKDKYSSLRRTFIKGDNIHRFTNEAKRRLLLDLSIHSSLALKKSEKFANSRISREEVKELFLDKIIFAVGQYTSEEIYKRLKNDPMVHGTQLARLAYCSLKARDGSLTEIFTNPPGATSREEIDLAERVLILQETQEFSQFMDFLTRGIGKDCLDTYRKNGIQIPAIGRILQGSKRKTAKKVFLDLYKLFFTRKRSKSRLLKLFEHEGFSVEMLGRIFNGSGSKAPQVINELYQHWFCSQTDYLSPLRNDGIDAEKLTILLEETGAECITRFDQLHALWFDPKGGKTHQLELLEQNGVDLKILFSILYTRESCELNKTFHYQSLYDLWFSENNEKSILLLNLQTVGIRLENIASVLIGTGKDAAEVFQKFYHLWFDYKGRKTNYLLKFEAERIPLRLIFNILAKTGRNVVSTFQKLFLQWFEPDGTRTRCLGILEANGIHLADVCKLLSNEGCQAVETFENIYQSLSPQLSPVTMKTDGEERANIVEISNPEVGGVAKRSEQGNIADCVKQEIEEFDENFEIETNTMLREVKGEISNVKVEVEVFCNDSFIEGIANDYMEIMDRAEVQSISFDQSETINSEEIRKASNPKETKFVKIVSKCDELPEDSELLKFLLDGSGKHYLKVLRKNKIPSKLVANVLKGCSTAEEVVREFTKLYQLWFTDTGEQKDCLQLLGQLSLKLRYVLKILAGSGNTAASEFESLLQVLIGDASYCLQSLEELGVTLECLVKFLKGTGNQACEIFCKIFLYLFDENGNKTLQARNLESVIELGAMFEIVSGAKKEVYDIFVDMYNLLFDPEGEKTNRLLVLEKNAISLMDISMILKGSGNKAVKRFKTLSDCLTKRKLNKYKLFIRLFEKK